MNGMEGNERPPPQREHQPHHSSVMLAATLAILMGIIMIWLNVNVAEPTQGIFLMAAAPVAAAMGQPVPDLAYTPDYTILFITPVIFTLGFLYVKNKEKQAELSGLAAAEIMPFRG